MTIQDLIDQWRLHPSPEVGSCANQLAGWLRTQTPAPIDPVGSEPPSEWTHFLRLDFRRVLSEPEWREVAEAASKLPYVRGLRAEAVHSAQQDAATAFKQLFQRWLKEDENPAALYKVERICREAFTAGWEAASRGGGDTRPPRQDEKAIDR